MKFTTALLFVSGVLLVSPTLGLPQPIGEIEFPVEAKSRHEVRDYYTDTHHLAPRQDPPEPPHKPVDQPPIPPDPCNSANPPPSCPEPTIHPTPPPWPPEEPDECDIDDPPPYCDEILRKRTQASYGVGKRDTIDTGGGDINGGIEWGRRDDKDRANQTPAKGTKNTDASTEWGRRDDMQRANGIGQGGPNKDSTEWERRDMERANLVGKEGGTNRHQRSIKIPDSRLAARGAPEGMPYKQALDAGQGGYLAKRKAASLESRSCTSCHGFTDTGGHFSGEKTNPDWPQRRRAPSEISKVEDEYDLGRTGLAQGPKA